MINIDTNEDGTLSESGKKQVKSAMNKLANTVLIAISQVTPEDIEEYLDKGTLSKHAQAIQSTITQEIADADVPTFLVSVLKKHTSIAEQMIDNAAQSFHEAERIIAMDAIGKKNYNEVSSKDIWDKYNNVSDANKDDSAE
jgi:hypothetical protein